MIYVSKDHLIRFIQPNMNIQLTNTINKTHIPMLHYTISNYQYTISNRPQTKMILSIPLNCT